MKKLYFVAALLVVTASSFAASSGWTVPSKVTKVVVVATGGINVRVSPALSGCTSQSGYGGSYASVYPDHPGLKSIHATLLTAYTSGEEVTLYLSDDTCKVTEVVLGGNHYDP